MGYEIEMMIKRAKEVATNLDFISNLTKRL
jgi:hypothetical protein